MTTYEVYLRAYVRAAVYRPKEPGLFVRFVEMRPGRLERAAARAVGVSDGLSEGPLRSKQALDDELRRLLAP